jgi:hypothetical protein
VLSEEAEFYRDLINTNLSQFISSINIFAFPPYVVDTVKSHVQYPKKLFAEETLAFQISKILQGYFQQMFCYGNLDKVIIRRLCLFKPRKKWLTIP